MTLCTRLGLICFALSGACSDDDDTSRASDHASAPEDASVRDRNPPEEGGFPDSNDASSEADGQSDAAERATFTEVYRILQTRCGPCHVGSVLGAFGFDNPESAYTQLVGAPAAALVCDDGTRIRVVPYDATASLLVDKLAEVPACGERMPMNADPLPADEIALIRAWIDGGALPD